MITFEEDTESNYTHRTEMNAMLADATIAFCVDFDTKGERETKEFALKHGKKYFQVDLNAMKSHFTKGYFKTFIFIADELCKSNCHSLNIAGNGMWRLNKNGISQDECDQLVYNALFDIIEAYGAKITSIRSGGQTGADESGLKAAEKLGINSKCLCPKGWRFYSMDGDIRDEELFKKRFNNTKREES